MDENMNKMFVLCVVLIKQ